MSRDLNSELAKVKAGSTALLKSYPGYRVAVIRCNSDWKSKRMQGGDVGCGERAKLVAKRAIELCGEYWGSDVVRFVLVDGPVRRRQKKKSVNR